MPTSSRSVSLPPARRHFCTVVKRGAGGAFAPEKYGFSGCIPAEMKSVDGSSGGGIRGNDGKRRCSFDSKNERKPSRSSAVVRIPTIVPGWFPRLRARHRRRTLDGLPLPRWRQSMPPTSPRGTPVSLTSRYRRKRHAGVTPSCRLRDDSSRQCAPRAFVPRRCASGASSRHDPRGRCGIREARRAGPAPGRASASAPVSARDPASAWETESV